MKKTITCLLLTTGLTGYLSAQTPFRDKSDKNEGKVIHMDKQMFLDNIFDYTSGSTIIFIPKTGQPQIIIGAANKTTFRKAIEEVLLKE